jgi:hypothetical protein
MSACIVELWAFMTERKKFWLLPLVVQMQAVVRRHLSLCLRPNAERGWRGRSWVS